jgi:hypothetical protein
MTLPYPTDAVVTTLSCGPAMNKICQECSPHEEAMGVPASKKASSHFYIKRFNLRPVALTKSYQSKHRKNQQDS